MATEPNDTTDRAAADVPRCNRSACRAPGATWWNLSTRAWYCEACARRINDGYACLCIQRDDLPEEWLRAEAPAPQPASSPTSLEKAETLSKSEPATLGKPASEAGAAGEGLRPCAHCGFDEPKVHEWYGGCAIYCPNCLVTTTHNGYPDRSHAVKVWQLRRTESPAPQPSAEADAARARGERSRLAEALRRYLGPSDIEWASLTEQRIPTAEGEARMAEQVEVVKRAQDEIP